MSEFDSWLEEFLLEPPVVSNCGSIIQTRADGDLHQQDQFATRTTDHSVTVTTIVSQNDLKISKSAGLQIASNEDRRIPTTCLTAKGVLLQQEPATTCMAATTANIIQHDQNNNISSKELEAVERIDRSDNDEAEPSLMVDSALSGGSSKTSVSSFCLDCFTPRIANVCSGCPRQESCDAKAPLSPTKPAAPSFQRKEGLQDTNDEYEGWATLHGSSATEFPPPLSPVPPSSLPPSLSSILSVEENIEFEACKVPLQETSPKSIEPTSPAPDDQETFDEFLHGLIGEVFRTPLEVLQSVEVDIMDDDEEELHFEKGGRKSAEDGKATAFQMPIMEALEAISRPCNQLCPLSGYCTRHISAKTIFDLRQLYFLEPGVPAPKDKQRAELIMGYLRKAKKDKDNNLIFIVDSQEVCTPAFLRLLGVTSSVDMTKTPGQWQRLIKVFLSSDSPDYLLSEAELKADNINEFTEKRGHATAFINDIAAYFSDTIPAVTSEDGETKTMVVPYRHATDLFREYVFHCDALGIGKDKRASYPTFVRACNVLRDDKVIKFLGGKSGFQTCGVCNNTLAIKQSACCKRDTVTRDALLKVHSLHLSQQATERQFAENFSSESEKVEDGQPVQAHFDFDGQSTWVGNTPKWSKDRTSAVDSVVENRNIGVRIVCGPIKEYISVCTNNLIPHGANVLVEVMKYSIEHLARARRVWNGPAKKNRCASR